MNSENEYINNLKCLNFKEWEREQESSSVFLVNKQAQYIAQKISPYIIIALDKAKEFNVDAIYFRFFDDERPPLAQIYIYDNVLNKLTKEDYNKIHREIWSGCEIPIYMIINKTEIKIFDSCREAEIFDNEKDARPIDIIKLNTQNDALKKYHAELFNNGAFWESSIANKHFLSSTSAAEKLLKSLRLVRYKLEKEIGKDQSGLSDRLLIMCILIKYLEENGKDPETKQNLASDFFYKNTGFKTLKEILSNNKLTSLLESLSEHFNGGIFSMKEKSDSNEDISINLEKLSQKLAIFFDASSSENLFGWSEYSFEHIPVELISNLYEEFLPKEKDKKGNNKDTPENGAVYTPSFLVNFLVDECLPLNFEEMSENIKLIDPACGSGIFLVTAFKRLVQRWRIKNIENDELANTEPRRLKQILKDNIYGIDIHYNSVHLTIFSLQLALCSMLKPKQIWTKRGLFNDLEKDGNIIEKDFFDYLAEGFAKKDFDLVIGNPPFKELHKDKFAMYREKLAKFREKEHINLQVPRFQEALLFLSTSFIVLKKETGKLCLIMKAGPFLYSADEDQEENLAFRTTIFNQYNVTQIIDFTLIKDLFKSNVETAAVFIENKPSEKGSISHIVVRKTRSVAEKSYFELSHYDFHEIPSEIATTNSYVWKCNLFSGLQVYHLVNRLKKYKTLGDFLNTKRTNGWDYGQGYKVGNKSKPDTKNLIVGQSTIVDKYFTESGIKKVETQVEKNFESIPENSKNIFSPPHLMIKKTMGKNRIPIELRNDYLTFKNEVLGIYCPSEYRDDLLNLEKQLISNNALLRFFIATTSSRSGVSRSMYTTELKDMLNMPLFMETPFSPSVSEQIIIDDVLDYYIEEFGRGKNSAIHKNVTDIENTIKLFSKVYCDSLNKIYAVDGGKRYYLSKLIEGYSFFACEYSFGIANDFEYEGSKENLDSLLFLWNSNHSVKYSRIMRIYGDNVIRLIKPKKLLFWLRSTALRDFNDTLEDALGTE